MLPSLIYGEEAAHCVEQARDEGALLGWRRRRGIKIETALRGVRKFVGKLFPTRGESFGSFHDPANVVGLVVSAEVDAGIAEPTEDGGHACGSFEAEGLSFVGRRALRLNFFEQFRGYPAAGGLAFVHFFGGFGAEHVDVAENWSASTSRSSR